MRPLFSKQRLAWYSWDFGTQLLLVNASIYFSLWLVVDEKVPDLWYSLTFILSTVALIFLSPLLGVLVDRHGNRKRIFYALTALAIVSGMLIEAASWVGNFYLRVALALICFALLNFFFQLAAFLYNTFLKDISTREDAGRVAGIGAAASTIGDALGLLATLPIILGTLAIFGTSRVSMLAPMGVLAALFSFWIIGAFRSVRDERSAEMHAGAYRQIWRDLRDTREYPGVTRLLIAFCFYNDAILTLQLFAAIYLEKVYQIGSTGLVAIIMLVYVAVALGSAAGGALGDALGYRSSLVAGLLVTAVATILIALGRPGLVVYALFAIFGIGAGISNANSKALFSRLIPYQKKGQFFGIYSIFERAASVIGPAAWSAVVYLAPSTSNLNYRLAALAMSVFLIFGAWTARKVRERSVI